MTRYLPIIVAAGLLAFFVTPLTRILARKIGMMDQPGLRKTHRLPVPLLGGLAIYAALIVVFFAFGSPDWQKEGVSILGGATLLFLTGLWDDRYGLPARYKLAAQMAAAVFLIATGVQVHLFQVWWINWPITLFWVVGITNATNLMDNMDGLAAGVSAVSAVFFFALAALEGQGLVASLAAALLGSALGFLFYNFAPAVSFMGDAGSLTLGFLLAVLGIKIKFLHFPIGATWMVPIVVLGVLIFDTALVTLSRLRRGRSIFHGGSDHTSHRLVQLGLSQPRAVLTLYLAAGALGALAIFLSRTSVLMANVTFAALGVVGLGTLIVFERIEPKLAGDPPLVLIPGGSGFSQVWPSVKTVSRDVTILLAPRRYGRGVSPSRTEVVEVVAALAEQPEAVRGLLTRGLSEEWWHDVNRLNHALRLTGGSVVVVRDAPVDGVPSPGVDSTLGGEPQPEAVGAIRRAKLILLGPGDPAVNLIPVLVSPGMRAALVETHGLRLWVGAETRQEALGQWLGEKVVVTSPGALRDDIQMLLLNQAAGYAKVRSA